MICIEEISKNYGSKKVLQNVSFTVEPGTFNAVVGENGAGKSTLLKIIMGELTADKGKVHLKGKTGYCPQEPLIFSALTVKENFKYFAAAYGLQNTKWKHSWINKMNDLTEQLHFTQYANERVENLSGGTKQKVNLAIALLNDPDILILDEPYGGFDKETYRHFCSMMIYLKQQNKCILMVTHLLNDINDFDKIFHLKEGQIK